MSEVIATVHWNPMDENDHERCPVCVSRLLTDPEGYGRALASDVYEQLRHGQATRRGQEQRSSNSAGRSASRKTAAAKQSDS